MAKFSPEEIPLEKLNSFTDNEFYYDEYEDTTLTDYEQPYEYLNENKNNNIKKIMNAFYEFKNNEGWVGDRSALLIHNAKIFRDNNTKQIYVYYNDKKIQITYAKNSYRFLSLKTIQIRAGVYFVRNVLGFENYNSKGIPPPVEAKVRILNQNLPQDEEIENSSVEDLVDMVDQVVENIDDIETLHNAVSEKKRCWSSI